MYVHLRYYDVEQQLFSIAWETTTDRFTGLNFMFEVKILRVQPLNFFSGGGGVKKSAPIFFKRYYSATKNSCEVDTVKSVSCFNIARPTDV